MKLFAGVLLGLVATAMAMYSPSDDVIELDPSNFNKLVIQGEGLWFIEFYAPWCGHCKSLAPEWKKAANALKGVVNIGAVDMDKHQSLGAPYNIQGFPTIKIFGADKSKPQDYNGQRTAQGVVDSAVTQVKSYVSARMSGKYSSGGGRQSGGGGGGGGGAGSAEDVIELTDSNFDKLVLQSDDIWLVEFFAPWCGHCKNLEPHWQSAASELKGKVKLGAVDATVHSGTASKYGVRGYPTIKYFPGGAKSEAEEYDGGRTSGDIVQWAMDKASANVPPPEVLEMVDGGILSKACDDHQLCMIAILPHILDCQSSCRNKYIEILQQMADKYKKRMWGWTWAEAGSQMEVEQALGIGGFGYPAMAAINSRKMKFALMKGSFSETGINEFLRELAVGRGSTAPIKEAKLPSVNSASPWDGKDGELPVEEDIDLSDVELDDLDDIKQEL